MKNQVFAFTRQGELVQQEVRRVLHVNIAIVLTLKRRWLEGKESQTCSYEETIQ